MFWVGNGVLAIGNKDVRYGEKIPSGVPEETIKSLLKKGKVAEKMPEIREFNPLAKQAESLAAAEVALAAAEATIAKQAESLAAAETTISELTDQIMKKGGKK